MLAARRGARLQHSCSCAFCCRLFAATFDAVSQSRRPLALVVLDDELDVVLNAHLPLFPALSFPPSCLSGSSTLFCSTTCSLTLSFPHKSLEKNVLAPSCRTSPKSFAWVTEFPNLSIANEQTVRMSIHIIKMEIDVGPTQRARLAASTRPRRLVRSSPHPTRSTSHGTQHA